MKIYLYPLGGVTKMNMDLNINPFKELIILMMGPLFQVLAYLLLCLIFNKELVRIYHYGILIFNLLPIYPLDGGKILNIFLNVFFPYKKTYNLVIKISYLIAVIIYLSNKKLSINMIITYIMLIILIRKEELKEEILYQKFLLERYLHKYSYKKNKIVYNIKNMYRYRNNIIKENNIKYSEKEYLNKKYNIFSKKY